MKNQYFGDVNDYRKYALLRHLSHSGFGRLLIAWTLTPDDGGADGRFRAYLEDAARFAPIDPQLYDALRSLLPAGVQPTVGLLDRAAVLPSASFYSAMVPEQRDERVAWRLGLLDAARRADLVFVDPDNGIEVKSKPIGRKGSSKYVAWEELTSLWDAGCSILTYQHFRREERGAFARRLADEFMAGTGQLTWRRFERRTSCFSSVPRSVMLKRSSVRARRPVPPGQVISAGWVWLTGRQAARDQPS